MLHMIDKTLITICEVMRTNVNVNDAFTSLNRLNEKLQYRLVLQQRWNCWWLNIMVFCLKHYKYSQFGLPLLILFCLSRLGVFGSLDWNILSFLFATFLFLPYQFNYPAVCTAPYLLSHAILSCKFCLCFVSVSKNSEVQCRVKCSFNLLFSAV